MMKLLRTTAGILALSIVAAACSIAGSTDDDGPVVTVFGPYRNDDAARFSASIAPFEAETGIDVRYVGTGAIASDLAERITTGNQPDVALIPQPAVVADLVERGFVVPLGSDVVDAITANYTPSTAELAVALQGVLYKVSVKSLVWYPPEVFAERGYQVPETWDGLIALTETMESDGLEPWCFTLGSFGATGWVGTDWVEDLMLRTAGIEEYRSWIDGDIAFDDVRVRRSFELFGEIVRTPGRVLGGTRRALGVHWSDAAEPMFENPPKCLLHRQASFYRSSLPSGVETGTDVDVFVLPPIQPGDTPPLLIGGDIAVAFDDRPEVQALLAYLATPQSGEAWARAGGYNSPHSTFDLDLHTDALDRRIGELLASSDVVFDASDQMPPAVGTGTFWEGIVYYVRTGDLDGTLTMIQDGYEP